MKTCECQKENRDEATFCDSCGRRLEVASDVVTPAPVERDEASGRTTFPRERIVPVVVGFVALALVLAVALTFGLRNVHIDIGSSTMVTTEMPLRVCATSVGDASETPVTLPAKVPVRVASDLSKRLAVYADDEGVVEVLAPTGWTCSAQIAADGSSSVTVHRASASGGPGSSSSAEEINASQTSACVGCREALACPLFVVAAKDYERTFHQSCPTRRPSAEVVTRLSGHVVSFTDPARVKGDADPSGGAYAATGVMTYYDDRSSEGSWTETCVLAPKDASTCRAVLANFESRYSRR